MALLTSGTLMALTGIDLGSYSCRALKFATQPSGAGDLARDVNGTLHDLTIEQHRKYTFTIQCEDVNAPVLRDVWRGKEVVIVVVPNTGLGQESDESERQFDCMLFDWSTNVDEWGAKIGWTMILEQV